MSKDKLIENLKTRIEDAADEDHDSVSWGYQEGVLLSVNEAKYLLQLLSTPEETDAVEFAEWCLKNTIGFDKERNVALYLGCTGRYNKTTTELYKLFKNNQQQ